MLDSVQSDFKAPTRIAHQLSAVKRPEYLGIHLEGRMLMRPGSLAYDQSNSVKMVEGVVSGVFLRGA